MLFILFVLFFPIRNCAYASGAKCSMLLQISTTRTYLPNTQAILHHQNKDGEDQKKNYYICSNIRLFCFFSVYLYTCFLYVIAHSMFDNFLFVHLCLFDARSCFLILRLKKNPLIWNNVNLCRNFLSLVVVAEKKMSKRFEYMFSIVGEVCERFLG